MTTRSATPRPDQEFAVAVAAEDGRGIGPTMASPSAATKPAMSSHTAALHRLVAHDALPHMLAPRLELRLDQRDEVAVGRSSGRPRGSTSFSEMKLTSATTRSIGSGRACGRDGGHPSLEARRPADRRQASDAAARGRHRPRRPWLGAAREQDLGEAAGRGADIEAERARTDRSRRRRAPPRASRRRARHTDAAPRRRSRPRPRTRSEAFADRRAVDRHEPGRDRRLGLGAALEQAALDQKKVGALAGIARLLPRAAISGNRTSATECWSRFLSAGARPPRERS